ncbi:DUF185 domain-containing protein [Tricharina praecox]|uniref:DUF185 domain-containing protein n=1 Tax=Tricharina praecox TaxID=43433 RepID=UPI00221FDAB8|nr:DUF185 domain-containing protein [Tricharina praecox]KAI5848035.1 DUF185 domain-containing protein [Tricharina praecox]
MLPQRQLLRFAAPLRPRKLLVPITPSACRYSIAGLPATPAPESKTFSTPLAKQLTEAIKTTGPIPLAAYMRQCLTSSSGGYYTTHADPFGRRGDFITSPEISQLFGEMLGVWLVTEWMAQGRPKSGVDLIELGPGRGTLMDDVLRTISSFRALTTAIESIHLVEASPTLRQTQASLLCGPSTELSELPSGVFTAVSKHANIPVHWHSSLSTVPAGPSRTPFILAHEFFDALPIHAFESTAQGWRELLVSPAPPTAKPLVIGGAAPEFALTRATQPTPHALLLPELSQRYRALKKSAGSIIEVSPESLTVVEDIAKRIGAGSSGAALIVDYGPLDTVPVNSLRGIRAHRIVSPFERPGEVDVSADVDFHALAERALVASERVEVHGPVEQGAFLLTMGMRERMEQLGKKMNDEEKKRMDTGFNRLVERGPGTMGKIYKVLAIVPERGGKRPVGFGGMAA